MEVLVDPRSSNPSVGAIHKSPLQHPDPVPARRDLHAYHPSRRIGMFELITDLPSIEKATGLKFSKDLLYPALCLDSVKNTTPCLLKGPGKTFLFYRNLEAGNIQQHKLQGMETISYGRYLMFDEARVVPTEPDLPSAVKKRIDSGAKLRVYPDLPFEIYLLLRETLPLELLLEKDDRASRLFVHRLKKGEIPQKFKGNPQWDPLALKLMGDKGNELRNYFKTEKGEERFTLLDQVMTEEGIDAILASSPIDVQELSGIAVKEISDGTLALYTRGEAEVFIFSPEKLKGHEGKEAAEFLPGYLASILRGRRVGVTADMAIGYLMEAWKNTKEIKSATPLYRRWREGLTVCDLSAYIIAAKATQKGVEEALDFARKGLNEGGKTKESEVYRRYRESVQGFQREHRLDLQLQPYFIVLHCSDRTLYPSVPSSHTLGPDLKCVRIDTGVLVYDSKGFLRACSDIGRSLVRGEGEELYGVVSNVLDQIISKIRPGMAGMEVFEMGMKNLLPHEKRFKELALFPSSKSIYDEYRRDVGHLLGKQEPTSMAFNRDCTRPLMEGMMGCIEIPWIMGDYSMGIEDMFLVTKDSHVRLTG